MSMVCPLKDNVNLSSTDTSFTDPSGLFTGTPGLAFMPEYQLNLPGGVLPETLYKRPMMPGVGGVTPMHPLSVRERLRSVPMSDSCVLKLKGLPYSTTEQEIYDFFTGYEVRKVAFVLESDGRPSGLAFAEFDSTEEALRAMQKNGEYIGDRYVKLLHVPKQEMEDQVKFGTAAIPKTPKPRSLMNHLTSTSLYGLHSYHPMPPNHTYLTHANMGLGHLIGGGGGNNTSLAHNNVFPMPTGRVTWGVSPSLISSMSLPTSLSMDAQMPTNFGTSPFSHIKHFANDGSTVRVRGLPFRVTEQEIKEFFQSFKFIPTSIQIDKDTSGRSSGEGWVTFINPDEARRAVRERNRQYLQNRYLELSILQIS
eukprot:g7642.t1